MSEWIGVDDDLPMDDCVDVWGALIGGHGHGDESRFENCFYDHEKEEWWTWNDRCTVKRYLDYVHVTHWMWQPDPPNT